MAQWRKKGVGPIEFETVSCKLCMVLALFDALLRKERQKRLTKEYYRIPMNVVVCLFIAIRSEAIASRLEAIATRVEAIAITVEAVTIAFRLEAIASRSRPSL